MSEKRFEINNDMNLDDNVETYELSCLVDNENKTFYFVVDSIANVESFVERLNELHEENKHLLRRNGAMEEEIECLSEENEQLRKEKNDVEVKLYSANENILMQMDYNEIIKQNTKEIINLKQENEQLKQQVQKIHKLINSKIQSARELGSVRTVIALKNLQRELNGDV